MRSIRLIAALLVPLSLAAEDFKNYEVGPRATALAGACVAGFFDPSSLFYNPASITGLEGTQLHLGGAYTSRTYAFSSSDCGGLALDSERASFPLASFAVTRRVNRFLWAGLGFCASTFHEIGWPTDRFNPLVYDARRFSLRTWTLTPTLAVKLSRRVSIGVGLGVNFSFAEFIQHEDYDFLVVPLTNGLVLDPQDFILSLKDCRSTFLSYVLGVQWQIASRLRFGFAVEGSPPPTYSVGSVVFREPETPFEDVNRYLASIFIDSPGQKAEAIISNIATVKWGLAWKPVDRLTVEADAYLPIWQMFDTVTVKFEKPMISGGFQMTELEGDFNWKSPISLRLGAEYAASDRVAVRLGVFHEPSPVPDDQFSPTFPFTSQTGICAGLGWRLGGWTVDFAYRALAVSGRSVHNDRLAYNGLTDLNFGARVEHLLSIGLTHRF
jgi:long-chain fatty acid transport protein